MITVPVCCLFFHSLLVVYIPMVIQNQMSFSQFIVLKTFLSATTAGETNNNHHSYGTHLSLVAIYIALSPNPSQPFFFTCRNNMH